MILASTTANLLTAAWLLPLLSFAIISISYSLPQLFGTRAKYAVQPYAAYIAIGAIGTACLLSFIAMFGYWLPAHPLADAHHAEQHESDHHEGHEEEADHETDHSAKTTKTDSPFALAAFAEDPHADGSHPAEHGHDDGAHGENGHGHDHANNGPPEYICGDWYALGVFGDLKLTLGYYIDTLTVAMFCMVTLIATCVHVYATGYMSDELEDYTDHEIDMPSGGHLHRAGRFHRFFQYLSLFSFSMLGIVISGNLAMVFVFWELVGICSYFLIGFYIERHSASTAANKAFIVNRVGDFGMLIGLMAIWTSLGTFNFGDVPNAEGETTPGMFTMLRSQANDYALVPADGMVAFSARDEIASTVLNEGVDAVPAKIEDLRADSESKPGQWLLFVAGVGLFCGCVGKSAQFPLHTWLPDAMEGPTPVSALVHSATMVAAGVYLVGRAYPLFTPEALLVIAVIGAITLFVAATIAITQTDIKRVLAYSTISQLGYMMLALGLGAWVAGLFHLITHAFFKSLLFLGSGSVIHAVHSNEMTDMGGLRKKMPVTAYTMLVGCLAIIGAGIPLTKFGLSGYYSKDAIIEQAFSYADHNSGTSWAWVLLLMPVVGAAITAFYMFRLWFMTFTGEPRNQGKYDHAHESPWNMAGPLVVLSVFAIGVGWWFPIGNLSITGLLEQARPVGTLATTSGTLMSELVVPNEHLSHEWTVKMPAGIMAFSAALIGVGLAAFIYVWGHFNPATLKTMFRPLWELSWHKWWFDELYDWVFVKPTKALGAVAAGVDRNVIDGIIHSCAWISRQVAAIVDVVGDRTLIDRTVDGIASATWRGGNSLRGMQTGKLRQYIMFIAIGTVVLFLIASIWQKAVAGG